MSVNVDHSHRGLDAAIERIEELTKKLKGLNFGKHDISLALQHVAHMRASGERCAEQLFWAHEHMMIETHDAFQCSGCERMTLNEDGHADNEPTLCDECYDAQATDSKDAP